MSKMSDLWLTIEEYLREGMDATHVAELLHVPVEWVVAVAKELHEHE